MGYQPRSSGSAAGSDTQVQFNDEGKTAGDSGLVYIKGSTTLLAGTFQGQNPVTLRDASGTTLLVQRLTPITSPLIAAVTGGGDTIDAVAADANFQSLYDALMQVLARLRAATGHGLIDG